MRRLQATFLLQLTRKGLAGDSDAARASLEAIGAARTAQSPSVAGSSKIIWSVVDSGADSIIDKLGIAHLKYPSDEARVRWELNPWMVEAALKRLGDKHLSKDEQREVWDAARTPRKVNWQAWWTYFGE